MIVPDEVSEAEAITSMWAVLSVSTNFRGVAWVVVIAVVERRFTQCDGRNVETRGWELGDRRKAASGGWTFSPEGERSGLFGR